jgi:hypothetical protein
MMVAFMLFSVGGIFSVDEGWQRYKHPHTGENLGVALFGLSIAFGLELFFLKTRINGNSTRKWHALVLL